MLIPRSLFFLFVLSVFSFSFGAPEARFVSVRYLEEQAFLRISEYFDGKENTGNRLICRSRSNLYWNIPGVEDNVPDLAMSSKCGVLRTLCPW